MVLVRRHRWLLLCLAFIAPLYLLWTSTHSMGYFADDGPAYMMMARHYSPYAAESRVNALYSATSRFPPLYPLVLAWSGAEASLHAAHLLTTILFLFGLVGYYRWLLGVRLAPPLAALLVLLVAALPGSWLTGLEVQSEYLYLLLSLSSLALLQAHEDRRRDELLYAAALLVAASELTRTIGITLFAPLLLAAWRSPRRTGAAALAVAVLPLLVWHALHRSVEGYGEVLGAIYGRHPWQFLVSQLGRELPALRSGFANDFRIDSQSGGPATDSIGLACLAVAAWRSARLKRDGLYIAAYLAIVLAWPYPEEAKRFLWVVLPVMLGQVFLAVQGLARLNRYVPRTAGALISAMLLLLALPSIALAADRYRAAAFGPFPAARALRAWYDPDPAVAMHAANAEVTLVDAMRRIRDEIPADGCVVAVRLDLINYYAERGSVRPPLNSVPDPAFQSLLRAPGCRYVFMSTMTYAMFPLPLHPAQRLGDQARVLDYVNAMDPPPANGNTVCILARLE